jgi:putative heme-binding domain-containing protein
MIREGAGFAAASPPTRPRLRRWGWISAPAWVPARFARQLQVTQSNSTTDYTDGTDKDRIDIRVIRVIRGQNGLRISALGMFLVSAAAPLAVFGQRGDSFDTRLRPPAEERALLHVPPGFEVQLVASEPEIQKPMNLAFDAFGRVWVTGSSLYPWPARRDALGEPIAAFQKNWDDNNLAFRATSTPPEPAEHGVDSVRILSDFGPDGRARKITTFADGLNIPIGVLPLPRAADASGDTALAFSIPAIWKLTDIDGDGRADVREKLYDGFGFKDTHGMSSSYWLWFDGWVYGTHGFANASEVTDRAGNVTKLTSGNTYRFRPDGSRFELYVRGQTNPFGLAFDARGDLYTADSHSKPVYLLVPGGYYEGIGREHDGLGFAPPITADDHGSSAIAGIAHYSATHFPREFHDNLFNGNPVTRRINRARLDWRGSSPNAARQTDFLTSEDPAFRPVQVKLGPDGALWIADFYNPIIGHYEVPLTHPARDQAHGRIWRVVWRGLDGTVPAPQLPNLSTTSAMALVPRLSAPNLIVRSIAVSELLTRKNASITVPALRAALSSLVNGVDSADDETAALPIFLALERLGATDDALLRKALTRRDSGVALAALRALATREMLPPDAEEIFTEFLGRTALSQSSSSSSTNSATNPTGGTLPILSVPGHHWRVLADILRRHPQPWAAPLLLAMQARLPPASATKDKATEGDFELVYALRLALKAQALTADADTLQVWAVTNAATAERVADVCLAVPTPAAARFLIGYLERTKFAGTRAGEFARHAVLQMPQEEFDSVLPLLRSLERAPLSQRLALAEGLATVARADPPESTESTEAETKPKRTLPDEVGNWIRAELLVAMNDKDPALALRAINAAKPLPFEEKHEPLRRIALDPKARDANRTAALRALTPDTAETESVLIEVLNGTGANSLRRTAAELLGTAKAIATARTALANAFATASADLALALAVSLAKSDDGAAELIDLAANGRVRPTLLRHRHVVLALEKRPAALRDRAAALTKSLPPEDARLDALIAQRLGASSGLKTDPARGAHVFTQHCAACHRFRDQGGNIGPTLDGIVSRTTARIVEDILDPSRNIDPTFRLTTLTLKNGETKSGINAREQEGRVLLTEPATGENLTFPRAEVAEMLPSPVSAMPAAFDALLSEQELFDLIEYLRSPPK